MNLVEMATYVSLVLVAVSIIVNLRASFRLPPPFHDVFGAVAVSSVMLFVSYAIWLFLSDSQRIIWSGIMRGVGWMFLWIVYIRPAIVALKHERLLREQIRKTDADIMRLRAEVGER